ncbi:MAG: nucleotidyltransferase [Bacteroidales bacterium]|nr:MAG: nucleotidyltransferase [Bacteroidales bacterium]
MKKKPTLLVLAAGIGNRYGGLKQLDRVGPSGETIMDYSVYDAVRAGIEKVVFVTRRDIQPEFHEVIGSRPEGSVEIDYAMQEFEMIPEGIKFSQERTKPWGTGHAILVARDKIDGPFIVVNADDFYGAQSFRTIVDFIKTGSEKDYAMIGYRLDRTLSDYGYVTRAICTRSDQHYLESIKELTHIEHKGRRIFYTDVNGNETDLNGDELVSMNIWGFQPGIFDFIEKFFRSFIERERNNPKAEFYIPDLIKEILNHNLASVKILQTRDRWFGVTYRKDKEEVIQKIRKLVDEGFYPESLW